MSGYFDGRAIAREACTAPTWEATLLAHQAHIAAGNAPLARGKLFPETFRYRWAQKLPQLCQAPTPRRGASGPRTPLNSRRNSALGDFSKAHDLLAHLGSARSPIRSRAPDLPVFTPEKLQQTLRRGHRHKDLGNHQWIQHALQRANLRDRRIYYRELQEQHNLALDVWNQKTTRKTRRVTLPIVELKEPDRFTPLPHGRKRLRRPDEEERREPAPKRRALPESWPHSTYSMFMPSTWDEEQRQMAKQQVSRTVQARAAGQPRPSPDPNMTEADERLLEQVQPLLDYFDAEGRASDGLCDGYSSGEDECMMALKGFARER